jgi:hypothetical protein
VKEMDFMRPIHVKGLLDFIFLGDALFDKRLTFSSKNSFVNDSRAR